MIRVEADFGLREKIKMVCREADLIAYAPEKMGHDCCGGCGADKRIQSGYMEVEINQYHHDGLYPISLEDIVHVAKIAFPNLSLADLAIVIEQCGYDDAVNFLIRRKCCPHLLDPDSPESNMPCSGAVLPEDFPDPRNTRAS